MKNLTCTLAGWAAITGTALCGDVQVTVTGTVIVDNYTSGPYAAAQVGDTIDLTFEVAVPGTDIIPGQETEYALDLATFEITINGSAASGSPSAATDLTLENDNPADAFSVGSGLTNGDIFTCEFDAGAAFWASTDITQLGGTYDVFAASTSDNFIFTGAGGFMRMQVDTLEIAFPVTIGVEVIGTITTNSYSSGPFSAGAVGDTVVLTFDVAAPGTDVVPGTLTNYAIDPATFVFDINGPTGAAFANDADCQIQNDFPVSDGFRLTQGQLVTGEFFSCEWGAVGTFFDSNDITQLIGTYDVAGNLTSFNYVVQGGGGFLEIFPDTLEITGSDIGTSYCGPATPNSSGLPATISAVGSTSAAANAVVLTATDLPAGEFGYFLAGQTQGFFNPPGSQGFICLTGNIGRFNQASQIIQGPTGTLDVDLTAIPVNPPEAVMSGQTWNFQCWYRDNNPNATSNFTDGVSITFD